MDRGDLLLFAEQGPEGRQQLVSVQEAFDLMVRWRGGARGPHGVARARFRSFALVGGARGARRGRFKAPARPCTIREHRCLCSGTALGPDAAVLCESACLYHTAQPTTTCYLCAVSYYATIYMFLVLCYPPQLSQGVSMERYLLLSSLCRSGYLVVRHPARWALERGERPEQVGSGGAPGHGGPDHEEQGRLGATLQRYYGGAVCAIPWVLNVVDCGSQTSDRCL